MNIAIWTLMFTFLCFLTSCQVKETDGGSGFISGHAPATNSFSLNTPASDLLVTGDVLTLTLSFPYPVTVNTAGGTPSLNLTIGATSREATYASGNGTRILSFSYTIVGADNDSDGITVNSLALNGGTMTFSYNGTTINCSTTISAKTFSGVLVDNTAPTITAFTQTNPPGFYHVGDILSFVVTFDEKVYVTGTPRIQLGFTTGGSVYANYIGGSGTSTLGFTYAITNTVADTDGYVITSPIDLNSGTIKDLAANDATISFAGLVATAQTYSASVAFDGRLPYVTTLTPPANGTYLAAQALDVTLIFDRAVNVTGAPYIVLTVGSNARQATYHSGTGTNTLVFRYITVPGDVDTDGLAIAATITQNGGTITGAAAPTNSFFTNAMNNVLSVPNTSGVIVGAVQPEPISVTRNIDSTAPVWGADPDNVWIIGQQLLITVGFNTGIIVNQTGGTPRIPITIGVTQKYATYLSGGDGQTSIVFTYTIVEGDLDTDGSIALGDIDLNGGNMTDSANTNATLTLPSASLTTTTIDGVRPTITSVTAPPDGTYSQVLLTSFNFTVNWSEAVNYSATGTGAAYIPLTIGVSAVNAQYNSGNNTATIIHRPTTLTGNNDLDGIVVNSPFAGTATIKDQAGNSANILNFASPDTTGVLVDTTAPYVTSVTSPLAGRYTTGQNLDFTLNFSEDVDLQSGGGTPYIRIRIGTVTRNATAITSGTNSSHTFRYTVQATDTDPDFVTYQSSNITIPGGSWIRDAGLNNLSPATFSDPAWTGVQVDEVAPVVSSGTTTAGTYVSAADGNSTITISLTMSEDVVVDDGGGTPSLTLVLATGNVSANYNPGTSTATILKFDYTISDATDMDLDGLSLFPFSIQLNGGTIKDLLDNDATLSIASVTNLNAVYVAPHAIAWMRASLGTANRSGFTVKPTFSITASYSAAPYYVFDGATDTLGLSSLPTVHALYMAIRSPAGGDTYSQELIGSGAATLDNANIDMTTTDSPDIRCSTSAYSGSGNTHNSIFAPATVQQCEFIFSGGASLPNSPFIPAGFSGRLAEIIFFDSALSFGQKNAVYNYLNTTY